MDGNKFANQLTQMAKDSFLMCSKSLEDFGELTKGAIRRYGMAFAYLDAARSVPFQSKEAYETYERLEAEWRDSPFGTAYRKHIITAMLKHTQA